jgi:nitrogen fixation NifU-like protein
MNDNYRQVFGEILADHHESPRNYGKLPAPANVEQGYNPLCGDKVTICTQTSGDKLEKCMFEGEGCSICMASASIMASMVEGLPKDKVYALIEAFREKMQGAEIVTGLPAENAEDDIVALYGIKKFPVRIKCALLPWATLKKGLDHVAG